MILLTIDLQLNTAPLHARRVHIPVVQPPVLVQFPLVLAVAQPLVSGSKVAPVKILAGACKCRAALTDFIVN